MSTTTPSQPDRATGADAPLQTAYALWAVFRRPEHPAPAYGDETVGELDAAVADADADGVTVRGFYDVSGLRADADVMVWLHGDDAARIQAALRDLRRTVLLRQMVPVWNAMGMHREAEFNKLHTPAFLRGEPAGDWITVYPFIRSYDWYLLPDEERSRMLREHGLAGAKYRRVLTNTIATFALSDYEWILPMESPDLVDLVDVTRALRYTDARLHVREELPFFTGRRVTTTELPDVLS
ncbi:hydrogen peroxide-dependent heme synthase [Curtobacterium sp. PhB136]|uniref:hydrogen peroxide-dependent heme synthase n=1 Tax=Curtobacterium sp. PhB136 TaxID=2485181 RepID=UPI00104E4BC5|nr:hydrogen peroxide-dependent heme synthase [Curtobacterium sp. PhB136]TCK65808.1 chlorite dismutase [Curtobacterium sp. PhB136]